MVIAGLHHIRAKSIQSAMLYVDAENTAAQELYRSLGFTDWGRDILYKVRA